MMNTDQVRAQAAREFDSRPALAEEFSSKEVYVAFKAAEARGAFRIFSKPTTTARIFSKPAATAAPAARSSAGVSKAPTGTMSVLDAMDEFKSGRQSYYRTDLVAHVASRTGMSLHDASEAIKDTVTGHGR
ncbi:hypothetical protein [Thiobacillus sp. 0-1251]|uniref:hypothetical protein n=1 Tax=Thiobacillus sp. 0-1251 TaxID=1895858 RepID=UPI0009637A42|nr:hypothetical protein [Thiobacillus sp. 0-1251]OJY57789.1 MAG: hypothetical protein BGP19_01915 [Thiobacillus sp. 0-1251]